jgi:CheY-like chemotaxis protein
MGQALEQVESKPTRRVLIIDDEDYVRQYMSLMIGSWGYEVAGCDKIQADDVAKLGRSGEKPA